MQTWRAKQSRTTTPNGWRVFGPHARNTDHFCSGRNRRCTNKAHQFDDIPCCFSASLALLRYNRFAHPAEHTVSARSYPPLAPDQSNLCRNSFQSQRSHAKPHSTCLWRHLKSRLQHSDRLQHSENDCREQRTRGKRGNQIKSRKPKDSFGTNFARSTSCTGHQCKTKQPDVIQAPEDNTVLPVLPENQAPIHATGETSRRTDTPDTSACRAGQPCIHTHSRQ